MNNAVFQPLIDALGDYTFYGVDMPGHGENRDVSLKADLHVWSQSVKQALVAANLERFHLVAWSLGGMLATELADLLGEQCLSLSLIASNPKFVQAEDWPHAMPPIYLQRFADNLAEDKLAVIHDFMALQVRGAQNAKPALEKVMDLVEQGGWASDQGLADGLHLLKLGDVRQTLQVLNCPVFFLLGKRDALVPIGLEAQLKELLPEAKYTVLAKSGHAPFISHTAESAEAIHEFWETVQAQ